LQENTKKRNRGRERKRKCTSNNSVTFNCWKGSKQRRRCRKRGSVWRSERKKSQEEEAEYVRFLKRIFEDGDRHVRRGYKREKRVSSFDELQHLLYARSLYEEQKEEEEEEERRLQLLLRSFAPQVLTPKNKKKERRRQVFRRRRARVSGVLEGVE